MRNEGNVWAWDPGKRTGYAQFDFVTGKLLSSGILLPDELGPFLDEIKAEETVAMVYEIWITYAGGKTTGSKEEASQAIGVIKNRARQLQVPLDEQRPENYKTGAMWANITLPKGHCPDDLSAILHGYFWMRRHNRVTTPLERNWRRKSGLKSS